MLKLQRTVETPFGTDKINLTLSKEKAQGPKQKETEDK